VTIAASYPEHLVTAFYSAIHATAMHLSTHGCWEFPCEEAKRLMEIEQAAIDDACTAMDDRRRQ
jgi:hypothetical protein